MSVTVAEIAEVTREHTLNARKTWPGAHACSCGWRGVPERKGAHGQPHHEHLAEKIAERVGGAEVAK